MIREKLKMNQSETRNERLQKANNKNVAKFEIDNDNVSTVNAFLLPVVIQFKWKHVSLPCKICLYFFSCFLSC